MSVGGVRMEQGQDGEVRRKYFNRIIFIRSIAWHGLHYIIYKNCSIFTTLAL